MTQEEKAKAYDEALKKIQPLYEQAKKDGNPIWSTYEYLIPELAESEDEIHRKWILEYLYDGLRKTDEQFKDHFKSAIDWLEKQKGSKREFHIPDYMGMAHYNPVSIEQKEQKPINESNMHEPTLDEARKWNEAYEKGYSLGYENGRNEQKPAWSEEDIEKMVSARARKSGATNAEMQFYRQGIEDALKSLRPSWKPSEEQMNVLRKLFIEGIKALTQTDCNTLNSIYLDLKKLM